MLARLRAFFNPRPCETCEALRGTIQVMRDHEAQLWGQITILQDALLRATRVAPPVMSTRHGEATPEAVSSLPPSWNSVKRKLEEKHRRKPEDQVEAHWQGKIEELEKEAGIQKVGAPVDEA